MISPSGEEQVEGRRERRNGDDKKPWSKVRHQWSSEGLSGSAWTAKKRGDDWNGAEEEKSGFDVAAEARAALGEASLSVLPDRDSVSSPSSPPSSPSFVRSLASRVASGVAFRRRRAPSPSLSSDVEAHGTCNGDEPRWRGAPCKGEAKMTWSFSDDDGQQKAHGSAVCDGFWTGMSWRNTEKCFGFSQLRASKGAFTMYKSCNGVEASKKGGSGSSCPWHGEDNRAKGMSSWCHGGASGAVVKKEGEEETEGKEVGGPVPPQPKTAAA